MIRGSLKQRTADSFNKWVKWQSNTVSIHYSDYRNVAKLLKDMGLNEFVDFQVRNGEVRFSDTHHMAFAFMNGLTEYKKNV